MLDDKQKVFTGIFIIILVTFGSSSYSLVSAVSSQSSIDHDKASVRKQESRSDADDGSSSKDKDNAGSNDNGGGSSGSSRQDSSEATSGVRSRISNSDTKSSDNSNNVGDIENNNNNNQAANDGSNTGTGENVPSIATDIPTPHRSCDQGSNCNDQQDPSNTDHRTAPTATKQNNTPFVLSLPFP